MDIDWAGIAKIGVGVVPAVVAVAGATRGPGALRSRFRHDVEMLKELPASSPPYERLLCSIDSQLERIGRLESEATRHWTDFAVGVVLVVSFGPLTLFLVAAVSDWYWRVLALASFLLFVVGLLGLFDSLQRVPRDAKGNRT